MDDSCTLFLAEPLDAIWDFSALEAACSFVPSSVMIDSCLPILAFKFLLPTTVLLFFKAVAEDSVSECCLTSSFGVSLCTLFSLSLFGSSWTRLSCSCHDIFSEIGTRKLDYILIQKRALLTAHEVDCHFGIFKLLLEDTEQALVPLRIVVQWILYANGHLVQDLG